MAKTRSSSKKKEDQSSSFESTSETATLTTALLDPGLYNEDALQDFQKASLLTQIEASNSPIGNFNLHS